MAKILVNAGYEPIHDGQGAVVGYCRVLLVTNQQLRVLAATLTDGVPAPPKTLQEVLRIQREQGRR